MWAVGQVTKRLNGGSILFFISAILGILSKEANSNEINCPPPAVPINSEISLNSTNLVPWTTAHYRCKEGFEIFGNAELRCLPSGIWKGELPFCGTNVAFRKPANQSTTVRGGSAQHANDGDRIAEIESRKCTETQKEPSPWWLVDLIKPYSVKVVRVTTKGCCGHQPLQDMEIRVGNSSTEFQRNPLCAWFPGTLDEGTTKSFTCARTMVGRYVFLQLVGVDGSLSLCEVEVFSSDELSVDDCSPKGAPASLDLTSFNRTCFEFGVTRGKSFEDAKSYCRKYNGDLVHAISPMATVFLHSELDRRKAALKTQLVWIGVQRDPNETQWNWINGEHISRPAWGLGQPNSYNGEQNCVVLDGGRRWLWNDVGCNLDYLHWICQYSPSSCGSPDRQFNTTVQGSNYTVGAAIKYECPEGHVVYGHANRTCTDNGLWSGSAPSCKYVNCYQLQDIENGYLTLQDNRTTYGARAIYKCNDNYTLLGEETRLCGDDGTWSGQTPKCFFNWCPSPPTVEGGVVSATGNKVGDTATYTCGEGYITLGKPTLTCEFGAKWSGKVPQCKYVDCGLPASIQSGKYVLINYTTTVESQLEYSCNEDYWLDGEKSQRCTSEGKWSSDVPSCELITCEEPMVPAGSYVDVYDFNIHSEIVYHCDPGHILRGESRFTCLKTGQWSGREPSCEYIDCGKVPPLIYGEVDYISNSTTHLNSTITYRCSKTYRLNGPSRRRCTESGQWSEFSPKCEEIRCPEPLLANHSILSVTGNDRIYGRTLIKTESSHVSTTTYKVGALVKYRCQRGYRIIGESLSNCEDTGVWSGGVPECIFVDCKHPGTIDNGEVVLASNATYYGAIALYSCNDKFELKGVSRRICLENGTWTLELPVCKEIQCKNPDLSNTLLYTVDSYAPGGIVQYSCPRGYNLQGNNTRVCLVSGKWTNQPPLCIPVECQQPTDLEYGHVIVTNGTIFNSAIEHHCIPGYKRTGPYLRKCLENATWSGEEPKCEIVKEEPQESSNLGKNVGIGVGVVISLLILLGITYLKLKKSVPVKNTENVECAERKDDRNASVVSYASLADRNGLRLPSNNIYQNTEDDDDENMYNAPYEETSRRGSGQYEPEPVRTNAANGITINGVSVR